MRVEQHDTGAEALAPRIAPRVERDRRRRRATFLLSERRRGFDRRLPCPVYHPIAHARERALGRYRDEEHLVAYVLLFVNAANLFDLVMTLRALQHGAAEGNPFMAALLASDPWLAAVVKVGTVAAVTLAIWIRRKDRSVLVASLAIMAAFAILSVYQVIGALVAT